MSAKNTPFASFLMASAIAWGVSACGDESPEPGDPGDAADTDGEPSSSSGVDQPDPSATTSDPDPETSGPDESSGGEETGDPPDSTSGSESDDGSTTAATAPEIVMSSPADGDAGVTEDGVIVIQFSEPMDRSATQTAYQSADIPASAVTFGWNAAGDEMTITPNAPLPYALGEDPESTEANAFSFTITTAAESEAGVNLASDHVVTFTTLRFMLQRLPRDQALSGKTTLMGDKTTNSYVGDYPDGDRGRYFVTFDLSALAPGIHAIEGAEVSLARTVGPSGDPFEDLGSLLYVHAMYDEFSQETHTATVVGSAGYALQSVDTVESSVDVLEEVVEVLDDPATFQDRLQLRLYWSPSETDGGNDYDGVTLDPNAFEFAILYYAP